MTSMPLNQQIITIAMVILGTLITRFAPFFVFPANKPTPKYIRYLGKVLPSASLGLLVIYALKDVSSTQILPEIIAVLTVVGLHLWKKQMMLSILGGTITYMIIVQYLF